MNTRLFKEIEKLINEGVYFELHKDMPNRKTLYLTSNELSRLNSLQEEMNYKNRGLTEEFIKEHKERSNKEYKEMIKNDNLWLSKIGSAEIELTLLKLEEMVVGDRDIAVVFYSNDMNDLTKDLVRELKNSGLILEKNYERILRKHETESFKDVVNKLNKECETQETTDKSQHTII